LLWRQAMRERLATYRVGMKWRTGKHASACLVNCLIM
jgi:hypothetical protein